MKTLLQINVNVNSGSHGKIVESIGRQAIDNGWRSVVAYGRAMTPSESELIRVGTGLDIKEHVLESRLFDNHGLASRKATHRFIKQLEQLSPDIVQLHVIHGYYLNYKILFDHLNSTDIPIVWTFHDTWAYTGHCGHYGSVNCKKWINQCESCPLKWKDYPKSITDFSKRNYNLKKKLFGESRNLHIVTVSEWLKHEVEQSFLQDKDIRVIHNGINLDIFHPDGSEKKHSRFRVIGVASQWGRLKGLDDFYKLRAILPKEYEIVLVGLKREQVKKLPEGIVGVERTESVAQLANLYSSADVFCNLTYADTFPTTNIEALACGTPVITYKTGGSPEILDHRTGAVVNVGDVETVSKKILQLNEKGVLERQNISSLCRQRAEAHYNENHCYEQYISLYDTLLGGGKFNLRVKRLDFRVLVGCALTERRAAA